MPNAIPVILNNGTTDASFAPQSIRSDVALFIDRGQGQPNLYNALELTTRRNNNGTYKANFSFSKTKVVVDPTTGIKSPGSKSLVEVRLSFPGDTTLEERTAILAMLTDGLSDPTVLGVMRDLEAVY